MIRVYIAPFPKNDMHQNLIIKLFESDLRRYIGEILLNIDDQQMHEAEEWSKKAIGADKKNGMLWSLGRGYALYAKLFKRKGDLSKAKENLNKAIEILKECGADGWVKKYEIELRSSHRTCFKSANSRLPWVLIKVSNR